ncbi:MAG: HupE/UreJ family protein [Vicinamibacterales bacterium]
MRGTKKRRRPALLALLLACATLVLCAGGVLSAHEPGATRVIAAFTSDNTYRVEVITDASALLEKAESIADVEPSAVGTDAAALERRLSALTDVLASRIHVTFDATDVRPALALTVAPASDALTWPLAHIVLTGQVPTEAKQFMWRFGWTFTSYSLSTRMPLAREDSTISLEGDQQSRPIPLTAIEPPTNLRNVVLRYVALGFTHLLPLGPDHMLFVMGLFLLNSRPRALLAQVSAFAVAHSLTLGLATYGLIAVPSRIIEPAIALSIAYVAIENLLWSDLKKWRIGLVFAFGLLHGLGFASALQGLGLPRTGLLTALASFNLGVAAAEFTVIAGVFLLVGWRCTERGWYRAHVAIPASAAIACTAMFWAVERIAW